MRERRTDRRHKEKLDNRRDGRSQESQRQRTSRGTHDHGGKSEEDDDCRRSVLRVQQTSPAWRGAGVKHNVIVHAVTKLRGGGKKKTEKNQDTEMISSETDSAVTGIVDKTDPELMNKLVDMSEEETEEALRTV